VPERHAIRDSHAPLDGTPYALLAHEVNAMKESILHSSQRADVVSLTALRVAAGVILAVHGTMKLMDIGGTAQGFADMGIPFPRAAVYLAIAGELLGGLGLTVGMLTRVAALGTLSSMLVAIIFAHLGKGLLNQNGGWEYPLILSLVSLLFVTHGAGPFSFDEFFARNLSRDDRRRERSYR
jgi:putative oxidoreductase